MTDGRRDDQIAIRSPGPIGRAPRACSIIVPVHNKASLTRQCLNTLLAEREPGIRREIIVVDDGSSDLTTDLLRGYGRNIQTIRNASALGFAASCNAGAAIAGGEYLIFLNNDTIPRRGWLEALAATADAHPETAAVGARLLFPNDTVQHAGVVFGVDRYPHHIYAGFPADHPAVVKSRPYQAVTAACCLIKRGPWQELGGFDGAFVNGWEDVDFCLRLGEAGYQIRYCAESVVYHLESSSRDLRAPQERQNRFLYAERWLNKVRPDDIDYYVRDKLFSIVYPSRYPMQITVSPRLAGVTVGEQQRQADHLLFERARQAAILLRNNLVLNVRVHEAEMRASQAELRACRAEERLQTDGLEPIALSPEEVATALIGPLPNASGEGLMTDPESPGPSDGPPSSMAEPAGAERSVPQSELEPILGRVESPAREPGVVTDQVLPIAGWALSMAGIERVETFIDDDQVGVVEFGLSRPDVTVLYPDFPDGEDCGFAGAIPMATLADGPHRLEIRIHGRDGRISPVTTTFEVDSTAVASGRIIVRLDRPIEGQRIGRRDHLFVSGWALSPYGIRSVVARIDDGDDLVVPYGALRPDVARSYPFYPEPDHCGFNASLRLNEFADGAHTLLVTITADDEQIAEQVIEFTVDEAAPSVGQVPYINEQYQEWLERVALTLPRIEVLRNEIERIADPPELGIIVPLTCEAVRDAAPLVESIRAQIYSGWQLALVVTPDVPSDLRVWAKDLSLGEPRIQLLRAAAGSSFAAMANGAIDVVNTPWLVIIAPPNRLEPQALATVALHVTEHPDTDMLYTDEDKRDPTTGFRWDPYFKPDWSPDLHLSSNYLGPFTVIRRSLMERLGRLDETAAGADAYDLALRASEVATSIHHLPGVLLSRSFNPSGADMGRDHDPAERAALERALVRREVPAVVEPGLQPGTWRVRYDWPDTPAVTVVLPTGGKMQFLRPCLDDLLHKTTYPNLEILVVDNAPGEAVAELVAELQFHHPNLRRVAVDLQPFNFSALINRGMESVETPYVVLLNDDITVITPDWIETMMEQALRPGVGIVGAKLLFPDGTIQHAGVVLGIYHGTAHPFKLYPGDNPGFFGLPNVVRNYLAVTFACALMPTDLVRTLGGLDEEHLPIAFNDVDLCLRAVESGYRVVYTPHASLIHHESVTKRVFAQPSEVGYLRSTWGKYIDHDPFYNPNLTVTAENASLRME